MYHSFLIHSSTDGHLGCFYVLETVNSAVMNIGVHVSLSFLVSSVCMPRSGTARSYGSSISSFFYFIDYAKAFDCVDHNKLWKILKEMGIPDHQICLLRNLYAGQEATVRTGHGTTDWFQIGKGLCQGCILSPFIIL